MKHERHVLRAIAFALPGLFSAQAWAAPDPTGVWVNDTGRGAIEIKDCGGALCGHVVWTKDTSDAKGCGKQIIGEAKPMGSGLWDGGWIYSPEKKRKYDVELKPLADGNLRVKGYAGSKFFSKTMIWKPAPADLVRCNAGTDAKAAPAPAPAKEAKQADPKPVAKAETPVPAPQPAKRPADETANEKSSGGTVTARTDAGAVTEAAPSKTQPQTSAAAEPAPSSGAAPESETEAQVAEADPADEGEAEGGAGLDDLKNLELGNGYGFKEVGNGKCRLKVPYVTITVDCPE